MKFKKLLKYAYILPTVFLFGLLLLFSVMNLQVVKNLKPDISLKGLENFTNTFENNLKQDFIGKELYIDLNGQMAKTLGFSTLNERLKLPNGHLVNERNVGKSYTKVANGVVSLSDFLKEEGIRYLCVPVPRKEHFYSIEYPLGYDYENTEVMDSFAEYLTQRGVDNINVNSFYRKNGRTMDDVYFKTDHHWRPESALEVTEEIVKHLAEKTPKVKYDKSSFAEENWETEVYKDWFLGSHGKRTGVSFAGVDDLSYIYPKFPTDTVVSRINSRRQQLSALEGSVYKTDYLNERKYFGNNPYCLYLGGDFPLAYIRNSKAVNKLKLMIIGDSYRLPAEAFLSTQFSEIYRIDTRYYKDGSFAEYVKEIEPDVVLSLFTNVTSYNKAHKYGIEEWNKSFKGKTAVEKIVSLSRLSLKETTEKNNYYCLQENVKSGAYELTLDSIMLKRNAELNGKSLGSCSMACVYDFNAKKVVCARYFISGYKGQQRWLFALPKNKDADYRILFYNGMKGDTKGNSLDIKNIELKQYK